MCLTSFLFVRRYVYTAEVSAYGALFKTFFKLAYICPAYLTFCAVLFCDVADVHYAVGVLAVLFVGNDNIFV